GFGDRAQEQAPIVVAPLPELGRRELEELHAGRVALHRADHRLDQTLVVVAIAEAFDGLAQDLAERVAVGRAQHRELPEAPQIAAEAVDEVVADGPDHAHRIIEIVGGTEDGLEGALLHLGVVLEREELLELIDEEEHPRILALGALAEIHREAAGMTLQRTGTRLDLVQARKLAAVADRRARPL